MNRVRAACLLSVLSPVLSLVLPLFLVACGGEDARPAAAISAESASVSSAATVPASAPAATSTAAATATATTAAASPAPLPADKTCALASFQQELMDRVNQARASGRMCGATFYKAAAPLAWNGKLFDAAAGHSTDMANNNYFSHISRDGRSFSERISAAGYQWRAAGENIAAGPATIEQVINDWLQSPNHCANIMNADFTEIGLSCAKNAASTYRQYWTMDLGRPL